MTSFLVISAVIALMILFTALFVAAEFSAGSVRRIRLIQMAEQGDSLARMLLPIFENPGRLDRYFAGCQVGISISSLVLGAYVQNAISADLAVWTANLLSSSGITSSPDIALALARIISVATVLILITSLLVIFGELFPKSLAIQYPEDVARSVYWPMRISLILFALPILLFNATTDIILRLLGKSGRDKSARLHSAEEIELLMEESHEGGLLDDNERRLLRNALRLRDLTARQVMVHRTKINGVPVGTTPEELIKEAIEYGHSRIPIYRETIDEIVGFVHIKDAFRLFVEGNDDLSSVIRDALYVPETLSVTEVWEQLNAQRKYLGVVFDEFGGTAGMLTQEDLIEEIFGELQDEFDNEMAIIARDKDGRIYLRGDLLVTDVNEYLELSLPIDPADTLSGLVFSSLGRPPTEGDELTFGDAVIRVESMEDLSVGEVSLQMPVSESDAPFSEWEMVDHD